MTTKHTQIDEAYSDQLAQDLTPEETRDAALTLLSDALADYRSALAGGQTSGSRMDAALRAHGVQAEPCDHVAEAKANLQRVMARVMEVL